MCGIVLVDGLNAVKTGIALQRLLIHRGYDSAGILTDNGIYRWHVGLNDTDINEFLSQVEYIYDGEDTKYFLGHNRWATHGKVCLENTHPVGSESKGYVVHNGTISNFEELCKKHNIEGVESDTVLFHTLLTKCGCNKTDDVEGDNIFIYAFNNNFYLIMTGKVAVYYALKDGQRVLCSEASPLIEEGFSNIKVLENTGGHNHISLDDIRILEHGDLNNLIVKSISVSKSSESKKITSMNDEIKEQLFLDVSFDSIEIEKYSSVHFFGCGSSYNAGLFLKEYLPFRVDVTQASLLKEHVKQKWHPNVHQHHKYFALSQSGESKDVLDCINELQKKNIIVYCLTNNPNSRMNHICDKSYTLQTKCGVEYAVAATKTFTSTCLMFMSDIDKQYWKDVFKKYQYIDYHKIMQERLARNMDFSFNKVFFFGVGTARPIASECALKMQEVANVPAWAMPANEVKHGPIALIDENTLCVFCNSVAPKGQEQNIQQVKARGARVFSLHWSQVDKGREKVADLINVIHGQNLAYQKAIKEGLNPDRPRSIAKTITV